MEAKKITYKNIINPKNLLLLVFSFSILFSFFYIFEIVPAFAADEGVLGAYPTNYDPSNPRTRSWFIYELKPGTSKSDSITVVNNSNSAMDVKVYAVDATTTRDGGFALLNESQEQSEVGAWIKMSTNLITIPPKAHKEVRFEITIPAGATVGDHAGGIIVQEVARKSANNAGLGLNIVSRIGTRVYETVPGEKVYSLEIGDLSYRIVDNHLVFTYILENKGNIILNPTGVVDIKDASGKSIDRLQVSNLGSVFPGKPIMIHTTSNLKMPLFGRLTTTVTIYYTTTKSISKSVTFIMYGYVSELVDIWPLPVVLLHVILLLLIREIFFHSHRVRKMVRQGAGSVLPQPQLALAEEGVQNVDKLFISHHIKLLVVLVSLSILVLSALFALLFNYLVLSKTVANSSIQTIQTEAGVKK